MFFKVVLITLDCVRPDFLSCYGANVKTPYIDLLAQKGVVVKTAYSHCPITGPTHFSIFTSTLPLTHGVRFNACKLGNNLSTLAEIFSENGYQTAGFIGAYVLNSRFGFDKGFQHYEQAMTKGRLEPFILKMFGYYKKWGDIKVRKFSRNANRVSESAIFWLKNLKPDDKFFIWLHYFDAHDQFRLPLPLHLYYFRRRDYKQNIEYIDSQLGRLMKFMKKKGLLDDVIFIITSDHGEVLNEYEFLGKKYRGHAPLAYNVTLKVPLIFSGAGIPAGRKITQVFRHIDIFPTLLSLAGISYQKYLSQIEGEDLSEYILGNAGKNKILDVYAETLHPTIRNLPEWRVLIRGRWKYVFMPQSLEEFLYDVEADPKEEKNLISIHSDIAKEMKLRLVEMIKDDQVKKRPDFDNEEIRSALKSLGYI